MKGKILSRYLPEETEENHKKPRSGYTVSQPRLERGTPGIQSRSTNSSASTFSTVCYKGVYNVCQVLCARACVCACVVKGTNMATTLRFCD